MAQIIFLNITLYLHILLKKKTYSDFLIFIFNLWKNVFLCTWQICQFYPFKEGNKIIQQKYKIVKKE